MNWPLSRSQFQILNYINFGFLWISCVQPKVINEDSRNDTICFRCNVTEIVRLPGTLLTSNTELWHFQFFWFRSLTLMNSKSLHSQSNPIRICKCSLWNFRVVRHRLAAKWSRQFLPQIWKFQWRKKAPKSSMAKFRRHYDRSISKVARRGSNHMYKTIGIWIYSHHISSFHPGLFPFKSPIYSFWGFA